MVKKAERLTKKARMQAEKWRSYWQRNINEYHRVHQFVLGRQWDRDEEDMLKTYKKVPLAFNKLATLIKNLIGEQQQNTPQLQVVPMQNCDEQTASIREAIVKELLFSSDSKNAFQVAAKQAFIGGFSAICVTTDYAYNRSFDLDIKFKYFKDPTRCYWDPAAEKISKTDGMYCGYLMRLSRAKFREMYGKNIEEKILPDGKNTDIAATTEEVAAITSPDSSLPNFNWSDSEGITIQHHYTRKYKTQTLYKLSNGRILNQDELDEMIENSKKINEQQQLLQMQQMQQPNSQEPSPMGPTAPMTPAQVEPQTPPISEMPQSPDVMTLWDGAEPVRIEDSRERPEYIIRHYKIAGDYILEETEFPSEQLPLIFMDQDSFYDINGKQVCRSFLVDAIDAQRYINYLGTQSAYVLKVSRYDQWIGSKKNVASNDTQTIWRDPLALQGMLTFDESPTGITPKQVNPPELSQSLLTQYQRAIEDLYTSTGLYPARLGQQGNEMSGAAIDARTRQGSFSTYSAFNAINRAIASAGEVVNEMIPRVYDAERVITLQMPDEGIQNIRINRPVDEYGMMVENDIRKGTYEVRLVPGPSYEGQKAEALESLKMILQANPQLLNLIADLYAENLPLANTIELKNRLKTIVPPQIIEAGKTGKMPQPQGPQAPPPDQQLAQAEMQLKQRELMLKEQELMLKSKKQQADVEMEIKKLESERLQLAAQLQGKELDYYAETHRTNVDQSIAHADNIAKILTHKIG